MMGIIGTCVKQVPFFNMLGLPCWLVTGALNIGSLIHFMGKVLGYGS